MASLKEVLHVDDAGTPYATVVYMNDDTIITWNHSITFQVWKLQCPQGWTEIEGWTTDDDLLRDIDRACDAAREWIASNLKG